MRALTSPLSSRLPVFRIRHSASQSNRGEETHEREKNHSSPARQ